MLTNGIYGINDIARPHSSGWSTRGALNFTFLLGSSAVLSLATWWISFAMGPGIRGAA